MTPGSLQPVRKSCARQKDARAMPTAKNAGEMSDLRESQATKPRNTPFGMMISSAVPMREGQ
jgi:hypothetical protein